MELERWSFKANFKKGLMKGLVSEQTMTFVGQKEAVDWMCRVNNNSLNGFCDYFVTDLQFVGVEKVADKFVVV